MTEVFNLGSFSHSIHAADGYDRKHNQEEMSYIKYFFSLLITNKVYSIPKILSQWGGFLATVSGVKHHHIHHHHTSQHHLRASGM